jgi:hypothetical protein
MTLLNRIQSFAALALAATILCGCKSSKTEPTPAAAPQASPERLAEVRANYAAVSGYIVGDVEGVDAPSNHAAVAGIDSKLVTNQSLFNFVDATSGNVINSGNMVEQTPGGRIIVSYDPQRTAPKQGDVVAVKSSSAPQ